MLFSCQISAQLTDFSDYKPMPLPQYSPPKKSDHKNQAIKYEAATKTATIYNSPAIQYEVILPNNGLSKLAKEITKNERGFSELEIVDNNTSSKYPYSAMTKLFMKFPNGKRMVCSATMVNPRAMITCGHCVYSHNNGGWVEEIVAVPGYNDDGNFQPFGQSNMIYMETFTGWTQNADWNYDAAVVILDRPVGTLSGWLGFNHEASNNHFLQSIFHTTGYPADAPYDGGEPYYRNGKFDFLQGPELVYSYDQSYPGQSGSGTYFKNASDERYVQALLSHGNAFQTGQVRLTNSKVSTMADAIINNKTSRYDLIPLWTSTGKSFYKTGEEITELNFYVVNDGRSDFSGQVRANFYLSRDPNISSSDINIGSATYSNVNLESARWNHFVNASPSIPHSVSAGIYYVGVIITNNDGDKNNNATSLWDVKRISVAKGNTTSVENESEKNQIMIYPNPVNSEMELLMDLEENEEVSFDVYDLSGRLVKSVFSNRNLVGESSIKVDMREFKSGIYMGNVSVGDKVTNIRIVKI